MGDTHIRKNQEPAVVGDLAQVLLSNVRRPADGAVTRFQFPDGRFPSQRRHRTALGGMDEIFQMRPNEPTISEIVMRFHHPVPENILRGPGDQTKRERLKIAQRTFQGRCVRRNLRNNHRRGRGGVRQVPGVCSRKGDDQTASFKSEENVQTSGNF